MKKVFTFLAAVLLTATVWAQSPEKMSYQAVIRNSSDALVTNTQIGMEINIRQGTPSGTVVYTETQTPTTNANGLVSIEIGGGTGFNTIDWSAGPYFIETKTAIEPPLTTYTITGTSQLLSVPYALHAKTAETVSGGITETDPIYSASEAANITPTDITNLSNLSGVNTGDQDLSSLATQTALGDSIALVRSEIPDVTGFLTSETDPTFTSSQAANITATDITNLSNLSGVNTGDQDLSTLATQTALGDSTAQVRSEIPDVSGFLTSEIDPVYSASEAANITPTDITNLSNLSGVNTGDQDLSGLATKTQLGDSTAQVRSEIPDVSGFLSSEVDPLFTSSQAANITATDITNLSNLSGVNTGDQDLSTLATQTALGDSTALVRSEIPDVSGFLTSETDPIWTASPSFGITNTNITNWNLAYGWGNHAAEGYLQSEIDGSVTNEIQALSISNDTVFLSNGGFVKLPSTNAWSLNGNAGTLNGTNFIGTTDNVPLNFKVNNEYSGKIDPILFNTFFGYQSGIGNTTGIYNTFLGYQAGISNTIGKWNVAIGTFALKSMNSSTGNANIAIGQSSLEANISGGGNTSIGHGAMGGNTSGAINTAVGYGSLSGNLSGNNNTALGAYAGYNATGSTNVFLGYQAGYNETGSNKLYIANSSTSTPLIYGDFSTATLKIFSNLNINNAYTFPNADGTSGQILSTNGAGVLGWSSLPSEIDGSVTNELQALNISNDTVYLSDGGFVKLPIPSGTEAGQMQYWNGTAWVTVPAGKAGQTMYFINNKPQWGPVMSSTDVMNPTTGRIWMDRNLGASQVATSSTDALAYGDLYQWGRAADGYEKRTSGATSTLATSDTPGHGDFITNSSSPYDWRNPQNDNLWQGVNGINNPCPSGYRIPTEAEWEEERASWSSNDAAGAFASPLKLPLAGTRFSGGEFYYEGSVGYYWSNTVFGIKSMALIFESSNALVNMNNRAHGFSVRCIKD